MVYIYSSYDKSIITLLTNVLVNICSENKQNSIDFMSGWRKGWKWNMKGLEEVEKLGRNECALHCSPKSPVMSDCSRPYQ